MLHATVPFATAWLGENHFEAVPTAVYGIVLLVGAAIAYTILERSLVAHQGSSSKLARALGSDRKGKLSIALYALAIGLSFVQHQISAALYVVVALIWLVPDRRIESHA
jgi:uncharacterized membrane protein